MPFTSSTGNCTRCFKNQQRCQYCPKKTFYNSVMLIEHLKDAEDLDDKHSKFTCSMCNNKEFSSKEAFINHLEQKLIHKYDLHQAACCGRYQDVDRLIRSENINITGMSHKVNPNLQITNHIGSTPMHCAALKGYSRCLRVMFEWPECNPNIQDDVDGRTPVHVAAYCGEASCLKILLKKGGKLDLKDKNGKTSLDLVNSWECYVVIAHYVRHCLRMSDVKNDLTNNMLENFMQRVCKEFVSPSSVEITPTTAENEITMECDSVPTDLLPYEILARGKKCIEIFKQAMAQAKAPASRMKVIVVGEVGAGKTSLTRSLSGQPFVEAREKTHGIQTCSVDEMMQNTQLNWSWKLADPEESHVDQIIATLLSKYLDLEDLPDVQKLLRQQDPVLSPLAALPPSPSDFLDSAIVQSTETHEYPGLFSSPSSYVVVTDKKIEVDGSPRKLPASLVARALFEKGKTKNSVKVNIWDFAGHQLYETMHHLFLNNKSLYLVVFSLLRMAECEEKCLATIHYWLNSIAVHTSASSPIFVVGTRRGKVDEKIVVHANEIIKSHFDDAFGCRIVRKAKDEYVFAVENSESQNDVGVSCLINAIKKEASVLPFVAEERPVKWLHCEEEILTYRQDANCQNCLTIDELRNHFVEKCNVTFTNEEFLSMLNFFHDSGLIILPGNMCNDCTDACIKDLVVLSPQYLVDVMTHIHDAPKRHSMNRQFSQDVKKLEKEGKVSSEFLEHMWNKLEKPTKVLIELLGYFNLVYPLHEDDQVGDEEGSSSCGSPKGASSPSCSPSRSCGLEYIIPSLLKRKSGEYVAKKWKDILKKGWESKERVFLFDFGHFLPSALFDYLLVHIYRQSKNMGGLKPVLRRFGGIFSLSNQFLLRIELMPKHSQIWVYCRCKNGGKFLTLVEILVREVNSICQRYFKFLKFVYGPPCPQENCPGARVDVEAVQRPCDSGSSDSQESEDETEKGNSATTTGARRVHVLPMHQFQPPYWCQREEIDEENLEDWKPIRPIELDKSSTGIDTTDSSKCAVVNSCCLAVIVNDVGGDEWKKLGRELRVKDAKIDNICKEEDEQSERCHQVILSWQKSLGEDATVEKMINALKRINRNDLAKRLKEHLSSHEEN